MDLPARVRNSESEPKKNNLASELLVVFLACVFLDCVCVQNKSKIFFPGSDGAEVVRAPAL